MSVFGTGATRENPTPQTTTGSSVPDSYDVERLSDVRDGVSRDPANKVWTQPILPNNMRPDSYYGALHDIPTFFAAAHGITANSDVIPVYDFGDYQVRNDAGYSGFEMYLFYAAGDFDRQRGVGERRARPVQFACWRRAASLSLRAYPHDGAQESSRRPHRRGFQGSEPGDGNRFQARCSELLRSTNPHRGADEMERSEV
jgi:hypothetical protein